MSTPSNPFLHLRCPRCAAAREGRLEPRGGRLVCLEEGCGMTYPVQDGVAVMLTFEGDFYHLRKALDPAGERVHRHTGWQGTHASEPEA